MQQGLLHNSIFQFWIASFTGLGEGTRGRMDDVGGVTRTFCSWEWSEQILIGRERQTDAFVSYPNHDIGILKFPWTSAVHLLMTSVTDCVAAGITVRRFRNRVRIVVSNCMCGYRSCDVGVMSKHNLLEQSKHWREWNHHLPRNIHCLHVGIFNLSEVFNWLRSCRVS